MNFLSNHSNADSENYDLKLSRIIITAGEVSSLGRI